MDDLTRFGLLPAPTAMRPLLGVTILVVEDSRYACDALRLMSLRSGARLRRADCLASARRHLEIYRPCVVLVDMGLPDGSGGDLIHDLAQSGNPPIILATSADDFAEPVAIAAGAHGFLSKPFSSLSKFQETILSHLPADRHPGGPRVINEETIKADHLSYIDDLAHVAELLRRNPTQEIKSYAARFLCGIAGQARDDSLEFAAQRLSREESTGDDIERLCVQIDERISQLPAL